MAEGGGICVGGGGASLTNSIVTSNVARGGYGGAGYRLSKGSDWSGFAGYGATGGDASGGGIAGGKGEEEKDGDNDQVSHGFQFSFCFSVLDT